MHTSSIAYTDSRNICFQKFTIKNSEKWPDSIHKAFIENKFLSKLSENGYEVIGRLNESQALEDGFTHQKGQTLYKVMLMIKKERPTLWDRFKYAIGIISEQPLTQIFHTEKTTATDKLKNRPTQRFIYDHFGIKVSKYF